MAHPRLNQMARQKYPCPLCLVPPGEYCVTAQGHYLIGYPIHASRLRLLSASDRAAAAVKPLVDRLVKRMTS